MKQPTRPKCVQLIRHWGGSVLPMALAAVLLAAFLGCSPARRYEVLSYFFDGVPDPNAPVLADGQPAEGGTTAGVQLVGSVHKPYADDDCASCHDSAMGRFEQFQKLESDVCMRCHESALNQYPVMHGPVAVMECNFCHQPHESREPHLLQKQARELCMQCHVAELLSPSPPQHLMPEASCITCHSGHGGQDRRMLTADAMIDLVAEPQPPTTEPPVIESPVIDLPVIDPPPAIGETSP